MALQEDVEAELLALQSIFEDRLHFEDNPDNLKRLTIVIYPATADNISSQYVCLKISFILPERYPEIPPDIVFAMSRGLSDQRLKELKEKMVNFAKERLGEYVLYDLIGMAKDILTSNNIPSCPCPVCLSIFHDCDEFLKTECYHYFHLYCLHQYLIHLDEEDDAKKKKLKGVHTLPCPVCRTLVEVDVQSLINAREPLNDDSYEVNACIARKQQLSFANNYKRQLENGGLIDLEYEKNKYLLSNIEQTYINKKSAESEADKEEVSADSSKCASSSNSNEQNFNKRKAADRRKNYLGNASNNLDNGHTGQRANRHEKSSFTHDNQKLYEERYPPFTWKKEKRFSKTKIHQEKGFIKDRMKQSIDKTKDTDRSACTQKGYSKKKKIKCANEQDGKQDCKHLNNSKNKHRSYGKKESSSAPLNYARDTQASAKSQSISSSSRNKSIPPPPGYENRVSLKASCS